MIAFVDRDYIANSSEELANIGKSLFLATKQNHLDEQVQMPRLLESLAKTETLSFPLSVRHTPQFVPDFQLLPANAG